MKFKLPKLREDIQCKGRIKAEGKKASFPFCYRIRVLKEDAWGKKRGVELHSRVSGNLIGYLDREDNLVADPLKAETWDSNNAFQIPSHMRTVLREGLSKNPTGKAHPHYIRYIKDKKKSFREILKAAKR